MKTREVVVTVPKGWSVHHVNGDMTDSSVWNLTFFDKGRLVWPIS